MTFEKYTRNVKHLKWLDKPWINIDVARGKMKISKRNCTLDTMATFLSCWDLPTRINFYYDASEKRIKLIEEMDGELTISPNSNSSSFNSQGIIAKFGEDIIGEYSVETFKGVYLIANRI